MKKKPIPYRFVLDLLEAAEPYTKPMFGCTAVYVGDRIVLILRERESFPEDNGVWLATTSEHHESLRKLFPNMRSLACFGAAGPTGWQVLPASEPDFEDSVTAACELVLRGDPRIGKVPKQKRARIQKRVAKKRR